MTVKLTARDLAGFALGVVVCFCGHEGVNLLAGIGGHPPTHGPDLGTIVAPGATCEADPDDDQAWDAPDGKVCRIVGPSDGWQLGGPDAQLVECLPCADYLASRANTP